MDKPLAMKAARVFGAVVGTAARWFYELFLSTRLARMFGLCFAAGWIAKLSGAVLVAAALFAIALLLILGDALIDELLDRMKDDG